MNAKFLLDTNIIVYSYNKHDLRKQKVAIELLKEAFAGGEGMVSEQVLNEFTNVFITKYKGSAANLEEIVTAQLSQVFVSCVDYPARIRRAIKIQSKHGLSYYDSMIIAAAKDLGCSIVYSEDMQDGQTYDGIKVVNPFNK